LRICTQEEEDFVKAYERRRVRELTSRGLGQRASQEHARERAAGALQLVEPFE
jgi:hypothetical protein